MRKIHCGCGCASFIRLNALFDTGATRKNELAVIEKIFAYKCAQCGNEYTDGEIENFVITDPQEDRVTIYREYD